MQRSNRTSKQPNSPSALSRNGITRSEAVAVITKNRLILASGHIAPEEALMVFQEGRRQA
jgi:hypothetical protein